LSQVKQLLPKAFIVGIKGHSLTDEEVAYIREQQPLGFILFQRNIDNKEQVKKLVISLKSLLHHKEVPVLLQGCLQI
jgi:beta-N-acetylhexosaminidase